MSFKNIDDILLEDQEQEESENSDLKEQFPAGGNGHDDEEEEKKSIGLKNKQGNNGDRHKDEEKKTCGNVTRSNKRCKYCILQRPIQDPPYLNYNRRTH